MSGKIFVAVIVVLILIFVYNNNKVKENFLPSLTHRVENVYYPNGKNKSEVSIPFQYSLKLNQDPTILYDNTFDPVPYSSTCRSSHANPSRKFNQIDFAKMASSEFVLAPKSVDKTLEDKKIYNLESSLPVSDMTSVGAMGEGDKQIVYDRLVYANRNSRLRSMGDPIRGDLPIVPINTGMWRTSARPSVDLHTGALSIMGGFDNETQQSLTHLVNVSTN